MSDLKSQILDDVKAAMKAKDKDLLGVLRMLTAAIKQREVDERIELNDTDVTTVIEKMIKQRKDSVSQYQAAGRDELAEKESFEISVLTKYLPEPLSADEVEKIVADTIKSIGANGMQDMGKVMAALKEPLQGRADMSVVSQKVKTLLN